MKIVNLQRDTLGKPQNKREKRRGERKGAMLVKNRKLTCQYNSGKNPTASFPS